MTQTVWVVECGCYEDRCVVGVYSSIDKVKEAFPPREANPQTRSSFERPGGWRESPSGRWSNGLDYDDAMSAQSMIVDE